MTSNFSPFDVLSVHALTVTTPVSHYLWHHVCRTYGSRYAGVTDYTLVSHRLAAPLCQSDTHLIGPGWVALMRVE